MKKLLIVDDEPHVRLLLERTLEAFEDEGVALLIANDGAAGLELIRSERPQLVFLDVMMPKVNGFDVCRTVKADPELAGVHVVMLTAKGQRVDKATGLEAGADQYLTKPFDPEAIRAICVDILGVDP